ncbi:hypothetical protein FKM82_030917 [Ascaphus truei]
MLNNLSEMFQYADAGDVPSVGKCNDILHSSLPHNHIGALTFGEYMLCYLGENVTHQIIVGACNTGVARLVYIVGFKWSL